MVSSKDEWREYASEQRMVEAWVPLKAVSWVSMWELYLVD